MDDLLLKSNVKKVFNIPVPHDQMRCFQNFNQFYLLSLLITGLKFPGKLLFLFLWDKKQNILRIHEQQQLVPLTLVLHNLTKSS